MFDIKASVHLEVVAICKFLKHCHVVTHVVTRNMSDLCFEKWVRKMARIKSKMTLSTIRRQLTILYSICPRWVPLWEQFICANLSTACSRVHLPSVHTSNQCPVTAKYPLVLSPCHASQVRLILPGTVVPYCVNINEKRKSDKILRLTLRQARSRTICCLNIWIMHAHVFLGDSSMMPWVTWDAISSIFLKVGSLSEWIG